MAIRNAGLGAYMKGLGVFAGTAKSFDLAIRKIILNTKELPCG